ncbi:hypothetical protein EIP86_009688 [Pleurotus ostreatoroseus]|nr:hypothetical protein EIP86_009688 [Pleurotus ostreatoroseus]
MSAEEEESNPYELLGVGIESTEPEIKTAYRQRSLKVHPDRNRGNPDAAKKFHELNQAYELLLDPLRRMALDAKMRLKEARKARFAKYDAKRKNLVDELEERERAFKKAKVEKEQKQKAVWRENERIMEEGRVLREQREKDMQKREDEAREREKSELEPPSLGTLDTTVRLKYPLSSRPTLTTPESLSNLLSQFGATETSEIVVSLKPLPPKKPKRGTALVAFKQVGDAFAAVCASGRAERNLQDIEVSWAEGKEPELIGWLKKMGKLGGPSRPGSNISPPKPTPAAASVSQIPSNGTPPEQSKSASDSTPFSTFPASFPDIPDTPSTTAASNVSGLDYESLTLMRLRQAERERLEREIREQEAQEE